MKQRLFHGGDLLAESGEELLPLVSTDADGGESVNGERVVFHEPMERLFDFEKHVRSDQAVEGLEISDDAPEGLHLLPVYMNPPLRKTKHHADNQHHHQWRPGCNDKSSVDFHCCSNHNIKYRPNLKV